MIELKCVAIFTSGDAVVCVIETEEYYEDLVRHDDCSPIVSQKKAELERKLGCPVSVRLRGVPDCPRSLSDS